MNAPGSHPGGAGARRPARPSTSSRLAAALLLPLLAACSGAPEPGPTPAPAEQVAAADTLGLEPEPQPRFGDVDPDTIQPGEFDQGRMWTFEFPPIEYFEREYGLSLDTAWFRSARLAALRIPSCSASFVSPNGLVMTNHHCARDAITSVAREGESLLDEGFFARSLEEERAVEDFWVEQLVEIVDVTAEVEERTAGLTGQNLTEARANAREEIAERIETERGGEEEGWSVEAIALYEGAVVSAYVFRRWEDVKLVMAPELQLGAFGGDPDNFTYPRYGLDVAFFRVYEEDGETPLSNEHFFRWSNEGVEAGDPIFIIGNPGSTSRLQTVAQLEFRRDVGDRYVLDFVRDRADLLEEYIDAFPEEAERYDLRNTLFSLLNQEKAMEGQVAGLEDPAILARRFGTQEAFRDSIRTSPELRERYADLFDEMAELQLRKRELGPGFGAFLGLSAPEFSSPTLHRALVAFQVLNMQRRGAPSQQTAPLLEQLRAVEDRPDVLDQMFVEARIRDFVQYYGEDSELVETVLGGRTVEGAAAQIVEGSVLSDSARAVDAVTRGGLQMTDPALQFVQAYVPAYAEFSQALGALTAREEEIASRIGRARFEIFGTAQPPDATFSLRIADGVVRGYEYNGTIAPPLTTFYGLYDHYYSYRSSYDRPGESPWDLPERWMEPPAAFDMATPLNFVSTADIIGGNSGSPVISATQRVVGVVFDGNIESLPGDYVYLPEFNRSVSVDARGIVEALDEIYDLDRIVYELETGSLARTEAEADRRR